MWSHCQYLRTARLINISVYRLYWTEVHDLLGAIRVFYRRKILLALLEVFGGSLTRTDCQKLLFLFCARRGKNYYDFFPHKYGNFSLILSQDKNRLADLGFLASHSEFQLKDGHSYFHQLEGKDQATLTALVEEVNDLRGEKLVRKLYVEFPHYTARSLIAENVLKHGEYELIRQSWNSDQSPCLFTLGYEGLSVDAYLDILVSNNIAALVDVRKNPISMKYGFSKTKLAEYTKVAEVSYIHLPDLGIPSNLRKDLTNPLAYQQLFDFYAAQILPAQKEAIERLRSIVSDYGRVAITCFEADYHFCHRHKVAEYLENDPDFTTPIAHLEQKRFSVTPIPNQPPMHGLWEENRLYSSI